ARVSENIDKIVNHRVSIVELQHPRPSARSTRRKSAIWISRRLRVSDKEKLQEIQETALENSGLGDLSEMRDKEICTSQRELLLQNG
ncbi:hypothetical protein T265_12434, partial [Opisthorchis viverrini]